MTKISFFVFLTIFSFSSWSNVTLKVGDILLQPTNCWSCNLIENEEQSIYSHIGIVIAVTPEIIVADSLGSVRAQTLEKFNSITEKGQKLGVLRFNNPKAVAELENNVEKLNQLFQDEFLGLKYDKAFLWDNFDEKGDQKLYCSEFIAKFLHAFMGLEPIIKRMHFSRNREAWERYFQGEVPVGKWGNSPADYERSHIFSLIGEL